MPKKTVSALTSDTRNTSVYYRQVISLCKELGIKNESSTWATVIALCSQKGRYKLAEDYFDTMIESGVEPTMYTWTALVQNIARGIEMFVTLSYLTYALQMSNH